jgi:hypothetical protein
MMNNGYTTFALVSVQEQFGGYEEGGWWKNVGIVKMIVNLPTPEVLFNKPYKQWCIDEFAERSRLTHQVKKGALAMGFEIKRDSEYEEGDFIYDIVMLHDKGDMFDMDYGEDWYPVKDEVVIGSIIPLDCPYYC